MRVTIKELNFLHRDYNGDLDVNDPEDQLPEHLKDIRFEEIDTDNGSFDAEKGALYDIKLILVNNKSKERFKARGGWYYMGSLDFNEDLKFKLIKPKKVKRSKLKKVTIYGNCIDGGDGSCYMGWFLNADEAAEANLNCECESVETYIGSNIHKEAESV